MNLSVYRRPVRELVKRIAFRQGMHSPCWLIPTHDNCALIVPSLTERMEYLRTFKRSTVDEAEAMRLITLGPLEKLPPFTGAPQWLIHFGAMSDGTIILDGRTIALRGGAL